MGNINLFAEIGRVLEQQKRLKKLDRYIFQVCRKLSDREARLGNKGLLDRFRHLDREVTERLKIAMQQSKAIDQIVEQIPPSPASWTSSPEELKSPDDKIKAAGEALEKSNNAVAELHEELVELLESSRRPEK